MVYIESEADASVVPRISVPHPWMGITAPHAAAVEVLGTRFMKFLRPARRLTLPDPPAGQSYNALTLHLACREGGT